MTTVRDVIDSIYRLWLEPPDYQPSYARLNGAMTTATSVITLQGFGIPEDEERLKTNTVIEIDTELMRVIAYDPLTKQATLQTVPARAQYGTTVATHDNGSMVKIGYPFPRVDVFNTLGTNIISLHPRLFTVRAALLSSVGGHVYPISDALAVQVLQAKPTNNWSDVSIQGQIVDWDERAGGRAFVTGGYMGQLWVRYKRRMTRPTTEDDELEDLGVDDAWIPVLMAGTVADMLVGRDVSQTHTEWIGQVLEAEHVPVGTRQNLAVTLRQYRNLLLKSFADEMNTEYEPRVRMLDPFGSVTAGGIQ